MTWVALNVCCESNFPIPHMLCCVCTFIQERELEELTGELSPKRSVPCLARPPLVQAISVVESWRTKSVRAAPSVKEALGLICGVGVRKREGIQTLPPEGGPDEEEIPGKSDSVGGGNISP